MTQSKPICWDGDDDFTVHPAAELFPMMGEGEFNLLVEDITINGLVSPGVMWQSPEGSMYLIDGRNRYMACKKAGVQYKVKEWKGSDPTSWVISQNLHRRHLNESQRAIVAAKAKGIFEKDAERRQHEAGARGIEGASGKPKTPLPAIEGKGSHHENESSAKAAKALNVSRSSVERATKVLGGTPELAEAVQRGEVSLSAAASVAKRPVEDQRRIVEAGPAAVKEAAKANREKPNPEPDTLPSALKCPVDCGDAGCVCAWPKTGMRTNGGCRCEERDLRRGVMHWRKRALDAEKLLSHAKAAP
jgi:ParB-like chromosome segregation protein Spo0J